MEKLASITNLHASKSEMNNDLLSIPIKDLQGLFVCLFEEARQRNLVHPSDVIVTRKYSALWPASFAIAEDIWVLANCLSNRKLIPRLTLVKNGKRGTTALDSWRSSERCQDLVSSASQVAKEEPHASPQRSQSFTCVVDPDHGTTSLNDHLSQASSNAPNTSLPAAESIASSI